jgi:hypothetical protein
MISKNIIITGISVKQQMKKAEEILKKIVIPRNKEFQKRKKKEKEKS